MKSDNRDGREDRKHEGHEEIEGHEESESLEKPGVRVPSPLSPEAERAMHQTIGCERPVRVSYRSVEIPGQRVDLIIEGLIVVELKTVVRLADVHKAQLISYLRTTGLRGGLLINFSMRVLKDGIVRVVL